MKIRTTEELQELLDEDFAWRRKELTSIYTNVLSSKTIILKTNLRIAVVMLYAHWEGFIKNAAELYLIYINNKKLNYAELKNNFIALSLKDRLKIFTQTNKNTLNTQIVDFLLGDLNKRAVIPTENIINTQSNLNSAILIQILSILGIDSTFYELKSNYIDGQLLNIRNTVAHGQEIEINDKEFENLYHEIVNLMTTFKNDLSNSALMASYKKSLVL